MDKYIPKVGEEFEWKMNSASVHWTKCGKCLAVTRGAVGYEGINGWLNTVNIQFKFRPIQTKADTERERLLKIIDECTESGMSITAKEIQRDGFTIPKKINRSEIISIAKDSRGAILMDQVDFITNKMCTLLGDLVEDDQ